MNTELREALGQAIMDATQADFEIVSMSGVGGGCIHTALKITGETAGGKKSYFAKVNDADRAPMFAAEADGLKAIADAGAVRVPRVIARGDDGDNAWLVLEWLDLEGLTTQAAATLGQALARQHRLPQEKFGWGKDNFIGSTPQSNGWSDDWLGFWREKRLMAQLRLAARNRLPSRMIDRGERLVADCEAFFRNHRPAPSLLHGDLWGGNAAATKAGPVLFDPAVYNGDREADIGMTQLFGGFPDEFLGSYRDTWPLEDGWRTRCAFYNIYHLLNHANLFGGGYVRQVEQSVEKSLAEIG